jgi:hypothetical protein
MSLQSAVTRVRESLCACHCARQTNRRRMAFVLILTCVVIIFGSLPFGAPAAEEKFKRLNGHEIRSRIIGKEFTDRAHWSDYFRKDGALISMDMGEGAPAPGSS